MLFQVYLRVKQIAQLFFSVDKAYWEGGEEQPEKRTQSGQFWQTISSKS